MPHHQDTSTAALHTALFDYSRSPGKYQVGLRQPPLLFSQLREVLQIAVGREGERANVAATSPGLRDSARFFVRTALLYPGADHYGVLGLDRRADGADLKDRYRLLMRLLHPDFAEQGVRAWPADFAVRVNLAYDTLSSAMRRREYDEQSSPASAAGPTYSAEPLRPRPLAVVDAGEERQSRFKMLAVACAFAGAALVVVSLFATGNSDTGRLVQRTLVLPVPLPTATHEPSQIQQREPIQTAKRAQPQTPKGEPIQTAMREPPAPVAPTPRPVILAPKAVMPAPNTVSPAPKAVIPGPNTVIPGLTRDPGPRQPPIQAAAPVQRQPEPVRLTPTAALTERPRQEPLPVPFAIAPAPPPPAPAPPPAPIVATAAPAVSPQPPPSPPPTFKPGPTLIEAQPLLSQLLQTMESGRGDRILNLLDPETRAKPSAQDLSRQYDTLVDGARPVRVSHVEFKSEPADGRLLVVGYLRVLAGEQTIGALGKKMVLRAEFASRGGTVVLTALGGGAAN